MAIVQRDHPNEGGPAFIFRERRQPGVHHIGKLRRESLHFFTYGPDRRVFVGRVEKVAWAGFRSSWMSGCLRPDKHPRAKRYPSEPGS